MPIEAAAWEEVWSGSRFLELTSQDHPVLLFEKNRGATVHGRYGITVDGEPGCSYDGLNLWWLQVQAPGADALTLRQGDQALVQGTTGAWNLDVLNASHATCDDCTLWERWVIWPRHGADLPD